MGRGLAQTSWTGNLPGIGVHISAILGAPATLLTAGVSHGHPPTAAAWGGAAGRIRSEAPRPHVPTGRLSRSARALTRGGEDWTQWRDRWPPWLAPGDFVARA